jgi:hypothetical protein
MWALRLLYMRPFLRISKIFYFGGAFFKTECSNLLSPVESVPII